MTGTKAEVNTHVVTEDAGPAFVECQHPLTQVPLLYRNPEYEEVEPERVVVACETVEHFAISVAALAGSNKLIELAKPGKFRYRDELGGFTQRTVTLALQVMPSARILCLDRPENFDQRDLLKWHSQYPESLCPWDADPEQRGPVAAATFAALENFKQKGVVSFSANAGVRATSINALRDNEDPENTNLELYWRATSPVYRGGAAQEVKLRLEVVVPEMRENKLVGELAFAFELWSPDAEEIRDRALDGEIERLKSALDAAGAAGMTIIRGSIT
jgi:hypothetical protein